MKILTIKEAFYYSVAMYMYKYFNNKLPKIFEKSFKGVSDIHNIGTRSSKFLYVPFCNTNRSKHTIRYYGPKIWNIIIREIDINCAIGTFKKRLRILLFSKHCTPFDEEI